MARPRLCGMRLLATACLSASVAAESFEVVLGLYEGAQVNPVCLAQTPPRQWKRPIVHDQ
jgi:hypothetical protein